MITRTLLIACFLSGAASLIYEILWTRAFSLMLGSTTQAAALVFAAFLTGLALGAWVFGQYSHRWRNPLQVYIGLELGIAVMALSAGLLLHHNADAIGAVLGTGIGRYPATFAIALLLVLPATLLMGGTLPVLLMAARHWQTPLSIVGRLYGWNTFGAAVGTLLCGFFTIRLLGVSFSYYLAAALNLLVALIAAMLLWRAGKQGVADTGLDEPVSTSAATRTQVPEAQLLLLAFVSGAVVLSLEIVWTRFASYFLGNRTYAFSALMFAVLTLLACGSWLSARLYHTEREPGGLFAGLLAFAALAVALSTTGGWWLISHQEAIEAKLPRLSEMVVLYRFIETFVLLAPPLLLLGVLFPLSLAWSRHSATNIGGASARFYALNAVGVVLGSLGTGFLGLTLFGSFGMLRILVIVLLVHSAYLLLRAGRPPSRIAAAGFAGALLALVYLPASYPTGLDSGESLVVDVEDAHGVFRITRLRHGYLQVTNNRSELVYHLGASSTDNVQQMQGHLGVHYNPNATDALVIGSGYGITAGALAAYDNIKRVDAVEMLPEMVAAADLFSPHNFDYHKNDKVHITVDDGRHFLLRSNRHYDIITLNVSDPHMPGGSTLFHTEFYELAKKRLRPGGVLIQHVFGSERGVIANTLTSSFAHTRFSRSYSNGYNVVASMEPLDEATGRPLGLPRVAVQQLKRSSHRGRLRPAPTQQRYEDLPPVMHSPVIATDDFPAVEFSWNTGANLLFMNE